MKTKTKGRRQAKPTRGPIRWTIAMASREFGTARDTVKRGLVAAGESVRGDGQLWTTRQIAAAIHGDLKAERIRKTRAEADSQEMENARERRELIRLDEARSMVDSLFRPVREMLLECPNSICSRVNPTDPQLARAALVQWVDQVLKSAGGKEEHRV